MTRRTRAAAVGLAACIALSVLAASRGSAQRAPTAGTVRLFVRPRVGDTLHLVVEQAVAMSGRRGDATTAVAPPVAPGKRTATPAPGYGPIDRTDLGISRVQLFAHSLVEASDLSRTTLLATTDSVSMSTGAPGTATRPVRVPVAAEGRQVRVVVTTDGAMRVSDPRPDDAALGATLSSVPGLLPVGAVSVGSEWQREMTLPPLPLGAYRAEGVVQARLRLDSLARGGRLAYVSIDGVLHRDGAARELPPGTRAITAGTLRGHMVVDRDRAWIVYATTVLDVQSEVAPGPAAGGRPMLVDLRIEQRVRVR